MIQRKIGRPENNKKSLTYRFTYFLEFFATEPYFLIQCVPELLNKFTV